MRPAISLIFVSIFCIFACKKDDSNAEIQFAVQHQRTSDKNTLLQQIYSNNNFIDVCVINEDPVKNKNWLVAVESGFEQAFKVWHAEGVKHPKFPLPAQVTLIFKRIPSTSYLKMRLDSIAMRNKAVANFRPDIDNLLAVPDDEFPQKLKNIDNIVRKVLLENNAPLNGCPQKAVQLIAFSDPAAIKAYQKEIDKKIGIFKNIWDFSTPTNREELVRKIVRIMFKGKMTYEEFKRKDELAEKNEDYLTRPVAGTSPPSITIQQTRAHEDYLVATLTHETGHLFGLGDVYVDRDLQTDLEAHPIAIMGSHDSPEVQGKIQPDDIKGLMASITFFKLGVKACGEGYHEFDNTRDRRSAGSFFCLPDGFEQQNFGSKARAPIGGFAIPSDDIPVPGHSSSNGP